MRCTSSYVACGTDRPVGWVGLALSVRPHHAHGPIGPICLTALGSLESLFSASRRPPVLADAADSSSATRRARTASPSARLRDDPGRDTPGSPCPTAGPR